MKKSLLLLFLILLALPALQAVAETRYVTDTLIVTVRDSKGNQYKTLATLPSNSPVEILDEDKTFVRVRTEKGVEGYILKQYITKSTPKQIIITQLQARVDKLQADLEQQQLNCQEKTEFAASSQAQIDETSRQLETAKEQLARISQEYDSLKESSSNVVALSEERDQLAEQNTTLLSELQVLQEENKSFHRSNMIQWFLAGGGVFFGGWLVGKLSRKKRGFSRL